MYNRGPNHAFRARLAGCRGFSGGRSPRSNPRSNPKFSHGAAFTLVELLIVVVIIGILATIVLPQFSNASITAKENTLKDELRYLRTQIIVYRAQHQDTSPGYPNGDKLAAPTAADFVAQLTKSTNEQSATSATPSPTFRFGPYLNTLPSNPLTGLSAVQIVGDSDPMPEPTGADYGWIYKPLTGEIIANCTGSDASGTEYKTY